MQNNSESSLLLQLPDDVLDDILLRLPEKSLLSVRWVCKLLNNCISSKRFALSYLKLWTNQDANIKNIFIGHGFLQDHLHVSRDKRLCMKFAETLLDSGRRFRKCRFVFEQRERSDGLHLGGCCDGILCFYEFLDGVVAIYVFNPVLKQCICFSRQAEWKCSHKNTKVCFFPDPETDDYKVVFVSVPDSDSSSSKVLVFSKNKGSWREIDTKKAGIIRHPSNMISISDLVLHKGSLYWMISDLSGLPFESFRDRLVYNVLNVLDLHSESVQEIVNLPKYLRTGYNNRPNFSLIRRKGSLAICLDFHSTLNTSLNINVMKEDESGWEDPVYIYVDPPCDICSGAAREVLGSEVCGCYHRFSCKMPESSWGYLMGYGNPRNYTYVMGDYNGKESLGAIFIPPFSSYDRGTQNFSCIVVDYVPSFVSI